MNRWIGQNHCAEPKRVDELCRSLDLWHVAAALEGATKVFVTFHGVTGSARRGEQIAGSDGTDSPLPLCVTSVIAQRRKAPEDCEICGRPLDVFAECAPCAILSLDVQAN